MGRGGAEGSLRSPGESEAPVKHWAGDRQGAELVAAGIGDGSGNDRDAKSLGSKLGQHARVAGLELDPEGDSCFVAGLVEAGT